MNGFPKQRALIIREAAPMGFTLAFTDLNGVPIDLSAYGARSMIRGAYSDLEPVISLTMGSGISVGSPTNLLVFAITGSQATAITRAMARGKWDLWVDPNGTPDVASFLVLEGDVVVKPVATR